jgi:hypothetical protein
MLICFLGAHVRLDAANMLNNYAIIMPQQLLLMDRAVYIIPAIPH